MGDTHDLLQIYNAALVAGHVNAVLACSRADAPGVLQLAAGGPIRQVGCAVQRWGACDLHLSLHADFCMVHDKRAV